MSKLKPRSIAVIGLRSWLDESKLEHNNQGYAEFCFYIKHRVPLSAVGRLFAVGRKTVVKWKFQYDRELKNNG
jgi:hypothetical protein